MILFKQQQNNQKKSSFEKIIFGKSYNEQNESYRDKSKSIFNKGMILSCIIL